MPQLEKESEQIGKPYKVIVDRTSIRAEVSQKTYITDKGPQADDECFHESVTLALLDMDVIGVH